MRSGISQFFASALLALLCLVSIGFNGISAKEYAKSREMMAEHRLDNFGNQPEGGDHHSGHGNSERHYPSKSEDKYKRPKPANLAPKPQYRPSKSPSLQSKALHPANRPPSYSSPAYKPASFTPPSYSPPAYISQIHTPSAYKPAANRPTAYSSPAYKPPAYSPPVYNPSTQTPPAYSSPTYTSAGYEPPAYTEASTYHPPAHSTPANSPPAYAASPSEPKYPYKHVPETIHGVSKGTSFDKDFPNFDDFVQQSVKFDQFKI